MATLLSPLGIGTVIAIWSQGLLSGVLVLLRFLARRVSKTAVGWDDWLMLVALVGCGSRRNTIALRCLQAFSLGCFCHIDDIRAARAGKPPGRHRSKKGPRRIRTAVDLPHSYHSRGRLRSLFYHRLLGSSLLKPKVDELDDVVPGGLGCRRGGRGTDSHVCSV